MRVFVNIKSLFMCEDLSGSRKSIILFTLVVIASCFFYGRSNSIFGVNFAQGEEFNQPIWVEDEYLNILSGEKKFFGQLNEVIKEKEEVNPNSEFENELYALVAAHPIEEMVPYIAKYDRRVAGLIVGIAKKESDWGKHAPSKSGKTCYNYWGYKGGGSLGHSLGYGCFATPEEGVDVIGKRIQDLVNKKLDTPSKMIVWKCGSTCAGHDPQGVAKWINDVNIYFQKINSREVAIEL